MKKINNYLYNIFFWTSRAITIFIFSICFFAVLNAKYIWSENFFPKILQFSLDISFFIHKLFNIKNVLSILQYSFYSDPYTFSIKYNLFSTFCINSQQIDVLLIGLVLILISIVCIKYILNRFNIYLSLLITFVIYCIIYLFTLSGSILFLPLIMLIIFVIITFINKIIKILKIKNFIKYLPIIGEILCIDSIFSYITNKKYSKQTKYFIILIEALILSNMLYFFVPFKNNDLQNLIISKSVYNINVLKDKIIFSTSPVSILSKEKYIVLDNANFNDIQDIIINEDKKEMYLYDSIDCKLYVLDINNYKIKYKIDFENISHSSYARICCNNSFSKLLIAFEDARIGAFLIDLNNYIIIKKYNIVSPNDYIIYNKYRDSFILTFYQCFDCFQEIKNNSNDVECINSSSEQGYIAISERNKEVYVAFHQQGRIGVYDAETMELKRKIKSNYTVKDITYDEDLNVLIAPAYFTGYLDIFLMDGTDRLLIREIVGYELREARFDYQKENLYVASNKGLYKKSIDIKKLIENVSHETK